MGRPVFTLVQYAYSNCMMCHIDYVRTTCVALSFYVFIPLLCAGVFRIASPSPVPAPWQPLNEMWNDK